MSVLFVVLPLALFASAAAVSAFVWSVRKGQLDDLSTPPLRVLDEDASDRSATTAKTVLERTTRVP